MKKILLIIIGVLIILAVVYSTKIKTGTSKDDPEQAGTAPKEKGNSVYIAVNRDDTDAFVIKECGLAYYPETTIKVALPLDWSVIETAKGAYDEWASYEFANKEFKKILIKCGGALDPTCQVEDRVSVNFKDKTAVIGCSIENGIRASVENKDKTAINVTFTNLTAEEAQGYADKITIN